MAMQAYSGTIIKKKEREKATMEAFGDEVTYKRIKVGSRSGGKVTEQQCILHISSISLYSINGIGKLHQDYLSLILFIEHSQN